DRPPHAQGDARLAHARADAEGVRPPRVPPAPQGPARLARHARARRVEGDLARDADRQRDRRPRRAPAQEGRRAVRGEADPDRARGRVHGEGGGDVRARTKLAALMIASQIVVVGIFAFVSWRSWADFIYTQLDKELDDDIETAEARLERGPGGALRW